MRSPKSPEGNPANRTIDRPADAKEKRHKGDATAATRLAVAKPLLGGDLSGEAAASEDGETADALKRAAENERRS
jgi:hypothetical protein